MVISDDSFRENVQQAPPLNQRKGLFKVELTM